MKDVRLQIERWVQDAPSVLATMRKLLDEQEGVQSALEAAEAVGRTLRQELQAAQAENDRLRGERSEAEAVGRSLRQELQTAQAENDQLRRERSEVADIVAEAVGKANEVLLRFQKPAAEPAGTSDSAVAAAPEAPPAPPATAPAAAVVAPAPAGGAVAAGPVAKTPTQRPTGPEPRRVLLVDDDEHFRTMVTEYLTGDRGYEVHQAASGDEALTLLPGLQPHIVLLDLMMPGGGMDTLQQIKTLAPGLCVVIVSANEDMIIVRKALALGAADYVTKPFDLDYLDAILNDLMTKDVPDRAEAGALAPADQATVAGPTARSVKGWFGRR
jgi:CheY-like chemotaxis protein